MKIDQGYVLVPATQSDLLMGLMTERYGIKELIYRDFESQTLLLMPKTQVFFHKDSKNFYNSILKEIR